MPISSQFKVIFIHIPKCAGTSIEKFLGMATPKQFFSYRPIKELNIPAYNADTLERRPQHLTALQLRNILPTNIFNDYYKFTVVRNPYQRLLSEYCYIHDTPTEKTAEFRNISFDSFVDKVLALDKADKLVKFDGHLDRQVDYILDEKGDVMVDAIFKFESIDDCTRELQARTGIMAELPHSRATSLIDAKREISTETKEKIYEYYKDDFILLDYER